MSYIFSPITPDVPNYPEFNEENLNGFYKPDVVSENFVFNEGGWPRSDIALINEQTSLEAAKIMLDRLHEVPVDNSNSGLTDAEIMLAHRSKYQQTPSEVTAYIERQLALRDAKVQMNKRVESSADNTIKFDEDESK